MAIYMPRHPSELRRIQVQGRIDGLRDALDSVVAVLSDSDDRDGLVYVLDEKIAQAERDLAAWS